MIYRYKIRCHEVPFGAIEKRKNNTYSAGTCGTWHRSNTQILKNIERVINKYIGIDNACARI